MAVGGEAVRFAHAERAALPSLRSLARTGSPQGRVRGAWNRGLPHPRSAALVRGPRRPRGHASGAHRSPARARECHPRAQDLRPIHAVTAGARQVGTHRLTTRCGARRISNRLLIRLWLALRGTWRRFPQASEMGSSKRRRGRRTRPGS